MSRLSRGLTDLGVDELLSEINTTIAAKEQTVVKEQGDHFKMLPVEQIQPGRYQPRRDFDPDALQELADSISAQGLLQPISVRPIGERSYEIIAGERRWRAVQLAGLVDIPAIVHTHLSEEATIALALIENIQREDLNPVEEAIALKRLMDEFSFSQQQVAESVGKSRSSIANLLRLLKLNDDVRLMVERGDLSAGHAKVLLALAGNSQTQCARQIVAKELSVRETERLVQRCLQPETKKETKVDPDIARFVQNVSEKLGANVAIDHTPKGKGKLTINYHSLDELDGILKHLGVKCEAVPA